MAQYGGLTRLQYVFWDEVADFGMPNPALQWLGGIQLKMGCGWKALDSTRFGHSFSNDYADGIYTRTVEFGSAQEETSLEIGLEASKSRHFVVRGTGQDGQQWLIASPNAPMTMTMTVVRTVGTVTIWKGTLKSETKEPLFQWSESNAVVRVRYSETPVVSNPVTVGFVPTPPQGSTVTTISAISTGSGRYTTGGVGNAVHVRTDGRTAEAQAQAAETARLQAAAQANALLEAQRIAQAQADAALMTAQQATLERQAAMATAESARLQAIATAESARLQAEADARIAAEAAQRRQVLADLVRLNNATVQGLQTATAQALAQAQAAVLAAQPKPYSGSAAAGAFLLTEPVENQPVVVAPEPVPYVPYTTQIEDTG